MSRVERIRQALETAITKDPTYAEGLACLSRVYTDMARFAPDAGAGLQGRFDRATALARDAIALAPNSSGAYHALALAQWFKGEVDESLAAFRAALALNPNDTEIMADFGLRLAVLMRWDEAIPLVTNAFRRNPSQATTFRMAFVIWHYCEGRHDAALREARLVGAVDVVYPHLFSAAAAAELGRDEEARAAVAEIERVAPGYGRRLVADLESRNGHPALVAMLTASMQKAGLDGVAYAPEARLAAGRRKG
jgi:tetratricopeptide (TPR) repeat protein